MGPELGLQTAPIQEMAAIRLAYAARYRPGVGRHPGAKYRQGVVSGPPRRSPKPPPPPRPKPKKPRGFDPSEPLLDLEQPRTPRVNLRNPDRKLEPVFSSLDLPNQAPGLEARGLGAVPMADPLQDAKTLVSGVSPVGIIPMDEPLSGGTQVASIPIPPSAPTPSSIIPGRSKTARRSAMPFIGLGAVAALTWAGAAAVGVLNEPDELPELESGQTVSSQMPASAAPKPAAAPRAPEPTEAKPGPTPEPEPEAVAAPSWNIDVDAAPTSLLLAGSSIVASYDDKLVGYADGAAAWTFEGAHDAAFGVTDGSVIVVQASTVLGLAAQDGSERFKAELPKLRKKSPVVVASNTDGEHVLIALADARFLLVTPPACGDSPAPDAGECVGTVGRLSGEYLEPASAVAMGEDGIRYLAEEDSMRAFDADLRTVFSASLPAEVRSMVQVPGGRLALQFGQEAALLDVERCRGRSEVRLRTDDTQGPAGCVLWRYGRAIDPVPPAAVDTSSLALNERGKLQLVAEGDDAWKIPLGAFGPVANGGDSLFTLAVVGDGLAVAEVDSTSGAVKAKHPLPLAATPEDRAQARLVWNAGTIAASVGPHIGVLKLAP